jgi:5-methylcytosine-specific restriction enzyme subunit McrC
VRDYDFILRLCLLIFDSVVLDARTGNTVFYDFREDEARMAALFEDFVFNFLSFEQRDASVTKPIIRWHDAHGSEHDLLRLPVMRTDVVLEWAGRRLVLDAKYYQEALKEHRGRERVRSSHLYQIFAYLDNMTAASSAGTCEGMLLYPVVEQPFSFTYRLKGYRIAIRSINLAQPWPGIHRDMLALLETAALAAA